METFKPLIIMDERERGEIRRNFSNIPCNLQIETLKTADYLISSTMGIERKRGDDLVASICDNRFFSQIQKMKYYYPESLIILENPGKMFDRTGIAPASIYGAIIYALYKENIPLITTLDEFETAQTIWSFAKYQQKNNPFVYEPLDIPSLEIGLKMQLNFIEGLIGVSEIKAKVLLDEFQTPWNVIQAIQQSETKILSSGKVKLTSGRFIDLKGFGAKFVRQNQNLLNLPFHKSIALEKKNWNL
ncbi:3'-flap repair endonuclease Xpf [Candidatus Lokiarchaeum ossiferum]|uniref:3'-flap repair endonuclease Xpf n=1 Tax=Candidatus Lokiarchaeum ossiferum TaxID=2951803 RepID=A0ABY6I044_9ARCH|nr:3'-flap repair endonuclease Xpf [Candidatus Lokiarchaeum sp. B-35]